jgi:Rap1a immunity proteins
MTATENSKFPVWPDDLVQTTDGRQRISLINHGRGRMSQLRCLMIILLWLVAFVAQSAAAAGNDPINTVANLATVCNGHKRLVSGDSELPLQDVTGALRCRSFFEGFAAGHGAVLGRAEALKMLSQSAVGSLTIFCPPPRATVDMAIFEFLRWSNTHPQQQDALPGLGISWSLEAVWPCGKDI